MTDWRTHLTPAEAKRLAQIDAAMTPLKKERAAILNRARVRAHYARHKATPNKDD